MARRFGGRPPRQLLPALKLAEGGQFDEAMSLLRAITSSSQAAANEKGRRLLGLAWHMRGEIEFERGHDEAGLEALFSAEEALSACDSAKHFLGMVQFSLGTRLGDLPGGASTARNYFVLAQAHLAGTEFESMADTARQHIATLDGFEDWRTARETLSTRLDELWDEFGRLSGRFMSAARAQRKASIAVQIPATMLSLAVLLLEYGDDDEVAEGLELLTEDLLADPDNPDGFFDALFNASIILDRPQIPLPPRFEELVSVGHDVAKRTNEPAHRAAAEYLAGVRCSSSGVRQTLERGLTHALSALADVESLFARTQGVALRRAEASRFDQYRHLAISLSTRLGLAATTGELIEGTRPQVLPRDQRDDSGPGDDELPASVFGDAWWVTADGKSAVAAVASANGLSVRPTIQLEQAIDAVGGPNS